MNKNRENNFIGISEDRLHHIIGVARECYRLSEEMNMPEEFCRKMFVIGWNHDIGYEFSKKQSEHAGVSADMIKFLGITGNDVCSQKTRHAIRTHGSDTKTKSLEWKILNIADLTIDSKGNRVNVLKRLEDIKERYGENSFEYINSLHIAKLVGLLIKEEY